MRLIVEFIVCCGAKRQLLASPIHHLHEHIVSFSRQSCSCTTLLLLIHPPYHPLLGLYTMYLSVFGYDLELGQMLQCVWSIPDAYVPCSVPPILGRWVHYIVCYMYMYMYMYLQEPVTFPKYIHYTVWLNVIGLQGEESYMYM